jgi:hypothetical protein
LKVLAQTDNIMMYFVSYIETSAGIDWHKNAVMKQHPITWFAFISEGMQRAKKNGQYNRQYLINFWTEFDESVLTPEALEFLTENFRG